MNKKDDQVKNEITKDDIEDLYKKIDKKHLNKSREDVKKEIEKYSTNKEIGIRNVVNSILAYEKGKTQSAQTNAEVMLAYSLLVTLITSTITILTTTNRLNEIGKCVGTGLCILSLIVGIVLLLVLSVFKIGRAYEHGFLISILENWSYEETKKDSAKDTENNISQKIDDAEYTEYQIKVKQINKNQPSDN